MRFAHGDHQRDRTVAQPTADEREHPRGRAVEPLPIVDGHQERPLDPEPGQQRQHRHPDDEEIRRARLDKPKGGTKGSALRTG
jgi:hypothetical protein